MGKLIGALVSVSGGILLIIFAGERLFAAAVLADQAGTSGSLSVLELLAIGNGVVLVGLGAAGLYMSYFAFRTRGEVRA